MEILASSIHRDITDQSSHALLHAEIAALERRWDKVKQIKQGMMQQLLTGRVRLVRLEPVVRKGGEQ